MTKTKKPSNRQPATGNRQPATGNPQPSPWYSGLKVVVFTCITNEYDRLQAPAHRVEGWDYHAWTNREAEGGKDTAWALKKIPANLPFYNDDPVKLARYIKIMGPQFFYQEYDLTIWIDGNQQIAGDLRDLLSFSSHPIEFGIAQHPLYRCVYSEFEAVTRLRKDLNDSRLEAQKQEYELNHHPRNFGLWATGFMVRLNTSTIHHMMRFWWDQVEMYSHRDQLSLPKAFWDGSIKNPSLFEYTFEDIFTHMLNKSDHLPPKHRKKFPYIHICTPYQHEDQSKCLGKAYNTAIRILSCHASLSDTWVLVQDYDIMWLTPTFYRDFQEAIIRYPDTGIFTCYASRTANKLQQYRHVSDTQWGSGNPDINFHRKVAFRVAKLNMPGLCTDITDMAEDVAISGFAMMFNLETWGEVGGFLENGEALGVDNDFAWRVIKAGKRIRRVETVYCAHYYRLEDQNDNSHLK